VATRLGVITGIAIFRWTSTAKEAVLTPVHDADCLEAAPEIDPGLNSLIRPPIRGLAVVRGADAPTQQRETTMTKPARKTAAKINGLKLQKAKQHAAGAGGKPSTKSAAILAMLASRNGVTVTELAASTGWQKHSVRGFLSGTVKKKLGREIASEVVDGERRYRIAG